ncbi:hypothetical protein VB780_23180 [Leptolyngbya sp. CCNP1308]|uniref:hypothetical protein n=1 Tax=Leptolyngbya sp. CCNP1308 TaxID=3110255 RepID=UPI002B219016|nr:hypothetical protein [Leptolyngbya sp. CCNP1308]MEA5451500.1 hypothetical protein [Leptolyngbya sp. CCNP1308]
MNKVLVILTIHTSTPLGNYVSTLLEALLMGSAGVGSHQSLGQRSRSRGEF